MIQSRDVNEVWVGKVTGMCECEYQIGIDTRVRMWCECMKQVCMDAHARPYTPADAPVASSLLMLDEVHMQVVTRVAAGQREEYTL